MNVRVGRLLLLLLVVASAVLGFVVLAPYGPGREVFVDIAPGTGTTGIAGALAKADVVRSRWVLLGVRALEGGTLKAGEYRFVEPASMLTVYRRLRRGDVYTIQVVIPEGDNLFDVAAALEGAGLVRGADFLADARQDTSLIRAWDPHAAAPVILATMVRRFGQVAARLGLMGSEVPRVVTMASLVEREVHVDAERPVVAGVFENRLRLGMPLQTDPAVVYGSMLRGTWTGVIHQSELHSSSPYNTYLQTGLPPGPICNPGVAALRAAMAPERTDYLYFVANADGTTRFATSLKEHNGNVAAYRAGTARAQP